MKYVAQFTFSTQVGEESWSVVDTHLLCEPSTTVEEIMEWTKLKAVTTHISVKLSVIEEAAR